MIVTKWSSYNFVTRVYDWIRLLLKMTNKDLNNKRLILMSNVTFKLLTVATDEVHVVY